MSVFGMRLKAARLDAKLSQEQLGLLAGLEVESARARMNRYERGTRAPTVELVQRIGSVVNLPVSYFYAVEDEEAALVAAFHRMPKTEKQTLLAMAFTLYPDNSAIMSDAGVIPPQEERDQK